MSLIKNIMKRLLYLLLSITSYILYGQNSPLNIYQINSIELDRWEFNIENDSDSLLCLFYSGSHGRHNSTRFRLPVTDTIDSTLIYKLDVAKQDLLIDPACMYYQVLIKNLMRRKP